MSTSLKKNICSAITPGTFATEMERSKVDEALPPEVQYVCLYWIQHLQKSGARLQDNERVHQFLQNHFLHWLEALGWMQKISEGIVQIINLEATTAVSNIIYLRISTQMLFLGLQLFRSTEIHSRYETICIT
jgi:hypothetical protein